jgi:NAD(P)-dependent dehydrogenase (short-subunit alcohol dehydrogenase family)
MANEKGKDRLKSKVAIITGASMGLGEAIALLFAREGARVTVADIADAKGEETVGQIEAEGGEATFMHVDVSQTADVERMVNATVETFGHLDILVSNVGLQVNKNVVDTTEEEWDHVLNTNLRSMFLCSKWAIPQMIKNGGGNIVQISSLSGLVGNAQQASYNASKHGVIGLAKCMAIDHAPDNIRVNVVCPGSMNTPLNLTIPEEKLAPYKNLNLQKRFADPSEVATAALYLASDEASYATGSVVVVDGGYTTL